MWRSSLHRLVSLTGIVLVLLNVLVPTISHALRAHDPAVKRAHHEMVLAIAGDWCVIAGEAKHSDLQAIENAVALDATLRHLKACDFCADAPLAVALPPQVFQGIAPHAATSTSVRFAAFAAELLRRPPHPVPASRAPPLV